MVQASVTGRRWIGWIPLIILPSIALAMGPHLPPWAFMWLLALAFFLAWKWQTWWQTIAEGRRVSATASIAYLFAWPGMDAHAFLDSTKKVTSPGVGDWIWAITKVLFGATLFWRVAQVIAPHSALLAGWVGMTGLVFLLHFGFFHLLALAWQSAGVNAQAIMQSPHRATSLAEFWGARWNLGFRQLTHDLVFAPVRRRAGLAIAILGAFLISGLLHDLVISLPAGAGYGLPTVYFLLQGLGVLMERSSTGTELRLGRGMRGWLFMLVMTAIPVVWLFHPPFVRNVILPFMRAAGAL